MGDPAREFVYGVDIRVRSIEASDWHRSVPAGTILFELDGVGSASLDYDAQSIRGGGRGVLMLLGEGADLVDLAGRRLDLFVMAAEGTLGRLELCAKAEFSLTTIPCRPANILSSICTLASVTAEAVLFHGKGCGTMIGFITLCVSVVQIARKQPFAVAKHSSSYIDNSRIATATLIRSGVGMMPAVECPGVTRCVNVATARGAAQGPPLSAADTKELTFPTQVNESSLAGEMSTLINACPPEEQSGASRTRPSLRPPAVTRSTDPGPVRYYIERDQVTGVERSMELIPGYVTKESLRSQDQEGALLQLRERVTSGRLSFSLDDCAHHHPTGPTVAIKMKYNNVTSTAPSVATTIHNGTKRSTVLTKGKSAGPRRADISGKKQASKSSASADGKKDQSIAARKKGKETKINEIILAVNEEDKVYYSTPRMSSVFVPLPPGEGNDTAALGIGGHASNSMTPSWWPLNSSSRIKIATPMSIS